MKYEAADIAQREHHQLGQFGVLSPCEQVLDCIQLPRTLEGPTTAAISMQILVGRPIRGPGLMQIVVCASMMMK